jgi:2'-5' RNA ligase
MNAQLTLFDAPAPVRPKYRLFLGTFPSAEAVESLSALQAELPSRFGVRGKFRPPHILHMTLHHLGDYAETPDRIVQTVAEACSAAMVNQSSFEVRLDHLMSFGGRPGNLPLVLVNPDGNAELMRFHQRLIGELMARRLATAKDFQFVPHVTLLYDRLSVPEQPVSPIYWQMREVTLVLSHLGQTRYDHLQRWNFEN